jgi:hypothetical protein
MPRPAISAARRCDRLRTDAVPAWGDGSLILNAGSKSQWPMHSSEQPADANGD